MSLVGSQGQDCSSVGVGIGQWRGWGVGRKPPEHGCSFKALRSLSSHHLPGQQRCQGKSKDRRLKGVGGWGAKSSGQSLQLRVLRKVHWERDIVQAGGGTTLCKGQRQESRRPPRPVPAVGARGSWKEGGKSNRAGLMGAAESSGP